MNLSLRIFQSGWNTSGLCYLNLSVVWEEIRDQWRFRFCILLISLSFRGSLYPSSFRRSKSGTMLLNFSICPWKQDAKVGLAPQSEKAEDFQSGQWTSDFREKLVFGLLCVPRHPLAICRITKKARRHLPISYQCCCCYCCQLLTVLYWMLRSFRVLFTCIIYPSVILAWADKGWKLCWWLKKLIPYPLYVIYLC